MMCTKRTTESTVYGNFTSNSQPWLLIDYILVKFSSEWQLVLRVSQFHDDQMPKEIKKKKKQTKARQEQLCGFPHHMMLFTSKLPSKLLRKSYCE